MYRFLSEPVGSRWPVWKMWRERGFLIVLYVGPTSSTFSSDSFSILVRGVPPFGPTISLFHLPATLQFNGEKGRKTPQIRRF